MARRLPLGLVGTLVLVAGVEFAVTRVGPADVSFIDANWADAAHASIRDAPSGAVLCLGDSQIKAGLQPRLIERRLGLPARNLALVGGQAASSALVFERALRAGARPRAVVVGFYPGLLASDLRINTARWPALLSPLECLDLALTARDPRLFVPLMMRALVPSIRRREPLRAAVLARLAPGSDASTRGGRGEARVYQRNWRANLGAHVLPDNPAFREELPPAAIPGSAARWRCKPENAAFARRLLARAEREGVPVFWLLPTMAPGLRAARERDGLEAAYLELVGAFQREFPGLTVLDPRPLLRDPSWFSDVCHLDRQGATALSLAVGQALEDALGGPRARTRWIALQSPTNDLRAADALLEDLAESSSRGLRR